jgi:superoxide dismutase, Fe-Mn family
MIHALPDLPFAIDALAPQMSAESFAYHHGKHHKAYVDKLNKLIAGTRYANLSLSQIIRESSGAIFNNAGQHWNHSFFWNCLTPDKPQMSSDLLTVIQQNFYSLDHFEQDWIDKGKDHFGSGWIWLVQNREHLKIEFTHDGDTPIRHDYKAILGCDLWEHAYYIDYRNDREKFLEKFLRLVNWNFVSDNFKLSAEEAAA